MTEIYDELVSFSQLYEKKKTSYTICHNLFRKLNMCSSAPKPHKPMHNCIVPGSANTLLSDPLVPPM